MTKAAMASVILFCIAPDHVWRLKKTCCNWNQPSMTAQMAERQATVRIRLLRPLQGQKATNGAVHAKPQMHQIGLKQLTCTKIDSGRENHPGRKTAKIEPTKINPHAAKTSQYRIGTRRCARAKLTRTSAQDSNIERPNNTLSSKRE